MTKQQKRVYDFILTHRGCTRAGLFRSSAAPLNAVASAVMLMLASCATVRQSQREAAHDRAIRRAAKLYRRLGGDPMDDHYPEKPPRMRWATYDRLLDKLAAADRIADERWLSQASKLGAS